MIKKKDFEEKLNILNNNRSKFSITGLLYLDTLLKTGSERQAARELGIKRSTLTNTLYSEVKICIQCKRVPSREKSTRCQSCLILARDKRPTQVIKEKNKQWRDNNVDYLKQQAKNYQLNNLHKCRVYGKKYRGSSKGKLYAHKHGVIRESYQDILMPSLDLDFLLSQVDQCECCGSKQDLTLDHHIPLSKGGKLVLSNTNILCRVCNSKKIDKDPEVFFNEDILRLIEQKFERFMGYTTDSELNSYSTGFTIDTKAVVKYLKHYFNNEDVFSMSLLLRWGERVVGVTTYTHAESGLVVRGVFTLPDLPSVIRDHFVELSNEYKDLSGVKDKLFVECRAVEYPYPIYDNVKLESDWQSVLRHVDYNGNYPSHINSGCKIINHFHKSIFTSNRVGYPSPVEAWYNDDLLRKVIENRLIYCTDINVKTITKGFNVSYIAPKVSVFKPVTVMYLLQKYAKNSNTVIDPFSGFSGRMLGSIALGKTYYGSDIRPDVIGESLNIVKLLKLKNVYLKVQRVEDVQDYSEYDVLLTCPPYGALESWGGGITRDSDYYIGECLTKINAQVYIFVVKNTTNYKHLIQEQVTRRGHLTKSEELVLVFKRST